MQKKTRAKKLCMGFARPKYKVLTKYKTLSALNFREKPSLDSKVIETIPKGATLKGTVDSNGWLKTEYGGQAGFICQKGKKVYCEKL